MGNINSVDSNVLLNCGAVASRWGINQETLLWVIVTYNLELHYKPSDGDIKYSVYNYGNLVNYDSEDVIGFEFNYDLNYETEKPHEYRPLDQEYCFFRRSVIKEFEQSNQELIKELKDQSSSPILGGKIRTALRHKERCRALAQCLWEQNPKQTIAGMVRSCVINRIGCERNKCGDKDCKIKNKECDFQKYGNVYPEETLKGWVRDLCPNPDKKGGRPRKGD